MNIGLVSEHPAVVNVLLGPRHCRTLQKRTFILSFRHYDIDRTGRHPFQSHVKSQDCILTHCLPIPGIFAIKRGTGHFKYIFLKNQKPFLHISMHFQNLCKMLKISKKKGEPQTLSTSEIIHCEKRGYLNAYRSNFRTS